MTWLRETLLGLVFVVPAVVSIGYFKRAFGISADVFMVWYYCGIIATLLLTAKHTGEPFSRFMDPPIVAILCIVAVGLTVGAGANIFTFRAYASAPNPGIVQAIQEAAVPLIFLMTLVLSHVAPKHFSTSGHVDLVWSIVGITLTLTGVLIIIFKSTK